MFFFSRFEKKGGRGAGGSPSWGPLLEMATLEGKTVVITGGADGLGRAWCEAFLLDGAKAAFLPAEEKEEMVAEFEAELDRVLVGHGVAVEVEEEEEKAEAV